MLGIFSSKDDERTKYKLNNETRVINTKKARAYFVFFLSLLILERFVTLLFFNSVYTDADQIIMWNGAMDYSNGVFHEPFFYGQAYNYMLESILSVPLLWLGIPVYIAVPIATNFLALFPFVLLSIFLFKREYTIWSFLALALPFFLPLNYTFLTSIPRGFVQAHLFIPFLFIPLLEPKNKNNIVFLYLGSALSFIFNQSSILLVLPIFLFVYSFHFCSFQFYLKSIFALPILLFDYYAKLFYFHHPERVVHEIVGMKLDSLTFQNSLKNQLLFEDLSPFFSGWGMIYLFVFVSLAIIALYMRKKREFLFLFILLLFLLITLSIPKTQEPYPLPNAGIFFSTSRLYLFLPLLLFISFFLIFSKFFKNIRIVYVLFSTCFIMAFYKYVTFEKTVEKIVTQTSFPVTKNEDLLNRAKEYKELSKTHAIDLIIHNTPEGWGYFFDAYSYHPLMKSSKNDINELISICGSGDRRTWLYQNSINCKTVLLNGFKLDQTQLKGLEYKMINEYRFIIKLSNLPVNELMEKLNLKYGNTPL